MRVVGITFLLVLFSMCIIAQPAAYNFHHLDQGQGLNEGTIRSFSRDKYGYMWIGASSGLNRFNGYEVTSFLHGNSDAGSVMAGQITALHLHSDGSFWVGGDEGIMEYNYAVSVFSTITASKTYSTWKFLPRDSVSFYAATTSGLAIVHTASKTISWIADDDRMPNDSLVASNIGDMAIYKGNVYITNRYGLIEYDPVNQTLERKYTEALSGFRLFNLAIQSNGKAWLTTHGSPHLIRVHLDQQNVHIAPYIFPERASNLANNITDLLVDQQDRLWLSTTMDGLCYLDDRTGRFFSMLNEPLKIQSLSVNHLTYLHQDKDGFIWIGTEGYGVNYFHPDQQIFSHILPETGQHSGWSWMWARSFTEDAQGNYWMATGEGVVAYDPVNNQTRAFKNIAGLPDQIHYNSVRGVIEDNEYVWILTGRGINRYNTRNKQMEFFDSDDGAPGGFYFCGMKSRDGRVWFCSRDHDGLYIFDPATQRISGISEHPVLKTITGRGVRSIYEDDAGKIWIGFNGSGIACYSTTANTLEQWKHEESDTNSLADDLVFAITADQQGVIWTSGINGISAYDQQQKRWHQYNHAHGLPTNKTSCLMVDDQKRLWIGTAKGLAVLDAERRYFKTFDIGDGLPAYEFADMQGYRMRNSDFILPSLRGFVRFNPLNYQGTPESLPCYISAFRVLSKKRIIDVNAEELTSIRLKPNQNYFSIELTSPYFNNPSQVWYAYQLDGFDPEWHYTQNRQIQYTNVPGGQYQFKYKVSADNQHWTEPKLMSIHINTVFYKTWWYWTFIGLCIAFIIYRYYQFRMTKQKLILELQSKASSLEKEKTLIQYETLKQQLNPHFLFNSLTSLRSLIRIDQKLATHFLDGLSKSYRYLLRSGDIDLVTLEDELNFVNTYVELQQTRFRSGLEVNVNVPDAYKSRMIAPVAIQNLLENAIKHNTTSEDQPLRVEIFIEQEYIVVQNNLQRYRQVETSNKRGLAGLKSLYRYHTSLPIILLEDDLHFTVKIPLL